MSDNNGQVPEEIRAATSEVDVAALQSDPELRALMTNLKVLETNVILARMAFARSAGLTFDSKRDVYGVLGYKDILTTQDFRARYQRGGIAGRIVDVYPNATWRGGMELIEDESKEDYTIFEQAWQDFDKRLQVRAKLRRVDKLAGLSTYAILLIGDGSPNMEVELKRVKPSKDSQKFIKYLTPFAGGGGPATSGAHADRTLAQGADATIFDYDLEVTSERFGEPLSYQLRRADVASAIPRPVHWSRVIHIAEDLLDDEVFGLPSLERVWNDLDNLDKITGGGSEAFWLRAHQGIHADIDKDMSLESTKDTIEALKEQFELYKHQLTRALRTRGVKVETLGSDVANFGPNADAIITLIAGSKGIPKRILTGSEMGELASSQDRDNWRDQIIGRQTDYAGPYIVRKLADRLIAYGYLPVPVKGPDAYEVKWPHIQTMTEDEKVKGAQGWAAVNQAQGELVFTDAEIREKWADKGPLTDEQRKEVADRKAEENAAAIKQQQEMMKATGAPAAGPPQGGPPQNNNLKAAEEVAALRLAEAIERGDEEYIRRFLDLETPETIETPTTLSILPLHRVSSTGDPLCGQKATNEWMTNDDDQVTCVKCIRMIRTLGDVAGHPFHGNQWTDGGGGDELAHPDTHVDTLTAHSDEKGRWTPERQQLHNEILGRDIQSVKEVKGRPPVIHMTGGGPASGKSSMINAGKFTVPSATEAVHVDPDALKKELPEYAALVKEKDVRAAAFTHEESSYLSKELAKRATHANRDIVLDGTGDNSYDELKNKIDKIRGTTGATVEANYATNDVEQALRFAEERGKKTGRYVPESYIRSVHAGVSQVLPKAISDGLFDKVTLWDTNIKGSPRKVASAEGKNLTIHDQKLWSDFLAKGSAK